MFRIVAGVVLLAFGAGVVEAQGADVIKQRQDLMGAFAEASKAPSAIMKGQAPFDLAQVQGALKTIAETSAKLKPLWPETSKAGGNTRALPVIWTDLTEFVGWFDAMAGEAKAAAAIIKDEASFKAAWPKVAAGCGGCHKDHRAAKK
jgi:cytochrome c556